MKAIDLTHIITEDMPVYPGTEPPKLTPANSYERDGFKETLLSLYTHTGTHIDPPAHIFPDGRALDVFPPEQFIGKALVIDCRGIKAGGAITLSHIEDTARRRVRRISCSLTWAGTGFGGRRRISATIPALTMRPSAL